MSWLNSDYIRKHFRTHAEAKAEALKLKARYGYKPAVTRFGDSFVMIKPVNLKPRWRNRRE